MALITAADISHLGAKDAEQLVEDFIAEVSRFAPCLTVATPTVSPEDLAYAKSLVRKAIIRWSDMRAVVAQESAGKQSVTWRQVQLPKYATERFTDAEKRELAALCSAVPTSSAVGYPRGAFPAADDYSGLFARPGWRS